MNALQAILLLALGASHVHALGQCKEAIDERRDRIGDVQAALQCWKGLHDRALGDIRSLRAELSSGQAQVVRLEARLEQFEKALRERPVADQSATKERIAFLEERLRLAESRAADEARRAAERQKALEQAQAELVQLRSQERASPALVTPSKAVGVGERIALVLTSGSSLRIDEDVSLALKGTYKQFGIDMIVNGQYREWLKPGSRFGVKRGPPKTCSIDVIEPLSVNDPTGINRVRLEYFCERSK